MKNFSQKSNLIIALIYSSILVIGALVNPLFIPIAIFHAASVIFVYYLGKPIFANFGVSDRNRFFTALTIGLILETTVFAITGTSGYKMISP